MQVIEREIQRHAVEIENLNQGFLPKLFERLYYVAQRVVTNHHIGDKCSPSNVNSFSNVNNHEVYDAYVSMNIIQNAECLTI